MVKTNAGRNIPRVATAAPATPATRKPMNPDVMTTRQGGSRATATASTNCWAVGQLWASTTPPYSNGTTANPLPQTIDPSSSKKTNSDHNVAPTVSSAEP